MLLVWRRESPQCLGVPSEFPQRELGDTNREKWTGFSDMGGLARLSWDVPSLYACTDLRPDVGAGTVARRPEPCCHASACYQCRGEPLWRRWLAHGLTPGEEMLHDPRMGIPAEHRAGGSWGQERGALQQI